MRKFQKSIIIAQGKIREDRRLEKVNGTPKEYNTQIEAQQLLSEVSNASIDFMRDYGFTLDDYYEMFGTYNTLLIQEEIAGAGMLLYALETNEILEANGSSLYAKGGGDIRPCFLEATGIAAGIALVGALKLSGQAGGKAVRKAFKTAIKKIGGRLAGGIGLAIMAIDFAICMAVDTSVSIGTAGTCENLLQARTTNTNEIILISAIDIGGSDNYVQNIYDNQIFGTYKVTYGYTPIAIQDITEDTPCLAKLDTGQNSTILGKYINKASVKPYERIVFDDIFGAILPYKL